MVPLTELQLKLIDRWQRGFPLEPEVCVKPNAPPNSVPVEIERLIGVRYRIYRRGSYKVQVGQQIPRGNIEAAVRIFHEIGGGV